MNDPEIQAIRLRRLQEQRDTGERLRRIRQISSFQRKFFPEISYASLVSYLDGRILCPSNLWPSIKAVVESCEEVEAQS